jgi:methionine-rich copper-binding protein CopC
MAIQISGVNVIDNERNINVGVLTATSVDVPPEVLTFSPTDASSDAALDTNIVITFNVSVVKGSGNITLREGSASGTVIQTIAVSSGTVSISGGAVTINPSSDLPTGKDIYVVVPEGAFRHEALNSESNEINTYNFTTGPITPSSFSPADGATAVDFTANIVITFSENISKGSGNITINTGSAGGTTTQTIDVTSGNVSVSGAQATINPPSDIVDDTNVFIVVAAGCFRNSDGDVASGNAIINTYDFTTAPSIPPLGSSWEGGYLVNCTGGQAWVVSPYSAEVRRTWYSRQDGVNRAQSVTGCSPFYILNKNMMCTALQCRTYWDQVTSGRYWNANGNHPLGASMSYFNHCSGGISFTHKNANNYSRGFRLISY